MQVVELLLQLGLGLAVDRALRELGPLAGRCVLELAVHEAFDEPVPPQERGDFGERLLHVGMRRLQPFGFGLVLFVGHGRWRESGDPHVMPRAWRFYAPNPVLRTPLLPPCLNNERVAYGTGVPAIRPRMMRVLRLRPGAPGLRS